MSKPSNSNPRRRGKQAPRRRALPPVTRSRKVTRPRGTPSVTTPPSVSRVCRREVCTTYTPVMLGLTQSFALSVGAVGIGASLTPWLETIARNFNKFRFRRLEVRWKSVLSTIASGQLMACYYADPSDPAPVTVEEFGGADGGFAGKVTSDWLLFKYPSSAEERKKGIGADLDLGKWMFVPDQNAAADAKLYSFGNLHVQASVSGTFYDGFNLGRLEVIYDVEFDSPVPTPLDLDVTSLHLNNVDMLDEELGRLQPQISHVVHDLDHARFYDEMVRALPQMKGIIELVINSGDLVMSFKQAWRGAIRILRHFGIVGQGVVSFGPVDQASILVEDNFKAVKGETPSEQTAATTYNVNMNPGDWIKPSFDYIPRNQSQTDYMQYQEADVYFSEFDSVIMSKVRKLGLNKVFEDGDWAAEVKRRLGNSLPRITRKSRLVNQISLVDTNTLKEVPKENSNSVDSSEEDEIPFETKKQIKRLRK